MCRDIFNKFIKKIKKIFNLRKEDENMAEFVCTRVKMAHDLEGEIYAKLLYSKYLSKAIVKPHKDEINNMIMSNEELKAIRYLVANQENNPKPQA